MVNAETIYETEVAAAQKISAAPKIDGKLDEAFWDNAVWSSVANRQVGTPLNNKCEFATVWDDKNLYIAVKVVDEVIVTENLNSELYNNDGMRYLSIRITKKQQVTTTRRLFI